LYPCVYAFGQEELVIGDLTTENLKELWENNDKWRPFRQGFNLDKIASCASCSLKLKCSLAGCRLRNYGLNKSFYNKPQECALDHTFLL
ncbi:MAG: SPASM domain-containing protein, partial [Bacteroides sp.]|nr:SPASM domain-containing protein [Bacteroides sp.]